MCRIPPPPPPRSSACYGLGAPRICGGHGAPQPPPPPVATPLVWVHYSMWDPTGGRIMLIMKGSAASLNVAGFAVYVHVRKIPVMENLFHIRIVLVNVANLYIVSIVVLAFGFGIFSCMCDRAYRSRLIFTIIGVRDQFC